MSDWFRKLVTKAIRVNGVELPNQPALNIVAGTGLDIESQNSPNRGETRVTLTADVASLAEAVSEDPALVASLAKQLGWFAVTGAVADGKLFNVTKRGDLGGTFGVSENRVVVPSAGTYLAILRAELQYASPGDLSWHYGAMLNVAGSGQLWGGRALGVRFSAASMDAIGVFGLGVVGITDHTTDTIGVAASVPGGELTVNAVTGNPDPCQLLLLRVSPAS